MSETSAVDLKVIPLCAKKKGKARVKVRLSQTDYPKVTQVAGMFYTEQAQIHKVSDLFGCRTQNRVPESTQFYVSAKFHFFLFCKPISRECSDAVFIFLDGLKYVEEIRFNKCIYIEDTCMERLSSMENLQETLYMMEVVSCGNVTDKGIITLHKLK